MKITSQNDPRQYHADSDICALCGGSGESKRGWVQYGAQENNYGRVIRTFPICLRCGGYGVVPKGYSPNTPSLSKAEVKHMLANQHRDDQILIDHSRRKISERV